MDQKLYYYRLTYRRLADAVYWAGGIPCFCDVEEETLALDKNLHLTI